MINRVKGRAQIEYGQAGTLLFFESSKYVVTHFKKGDFGAMHKSFEVRRHLLNNNSFSDKIKIGHVPTPKQKKIFQALSMRMGDLILACSFLVRFLCFSVSKVK